MTEAVRRVTGEESELFGASRTDSGAHAAGQVCHFDSDTPVPVERWPSILNRLLPLDLRVLESEAVDEEFSSRFSAEYRHYRYTILRTDNDPFRGRFAHVYLGPLNVPDMSRAAAMLVGRHNFEAFSEELPPGIENTFRELFKVEVTDHDDEIHVDIEGTAFMRGMMRRISGFLLEVGRGYRQAEDALALLGEDRGSVQWPVVLPARGLCLRRIQY